MNILDEQSDAYFRSGGHSPARLDAAELFCSILLSSALFCPLLPSSTLFSSIRFHSLWIRKVFLTLFRIRLNSPIWPLIEHTHSHYERPD